jgi:hypothetical protein
VDSDEDFDCLPNNGVVELLNDKNRIEEYPLYEDKERIRPTSSIADTLSSPIDKDLVDNDCRTSQYEIQFAKKSALQATKEALERMSEIIVQYLIQLF